MVVSAFGDIESSPPPLEGYVQVADRPGRKALVGKLCAVSVCLGLAAYSGAIHIRGETQRPKLVKLFDMSFFGGGSSSSLTTEVRAASVEKSHTEVSSESEEKSYAEFAPAFESCFNSNGDVSAALACCTSTSVPVLGGLDVVSTGMLPESEQGLIWGDSKYIYNLRTSAGTYTFWFATKTALNVFESDPWFFAPAFGGFDAAQFCSNVAFSPVAGLDASGPFWGLPMSDGQLFMYSNSKDKDTLAMRTDLESCQRVWFEAFGGQTDGIFNTQCFMNNKKQSLAHAELQGMQKASPKAEGVVPKEQRSRLVHGLDELIYYKMMDAIEGGKDLTTALGREPTDEEFRAYKRFKNQWEEENGAPAPATRLDSLPAGVDPSQVHHIKDLADAVYKQIYLAITTGRPAEEMVGRPLTATEVKSMNRIRNSIADGTWPYDENGVATNIQTAVAGTGASSGTDIKTTLHVSMPFTQIFDSQSPMDSPVVSLGTVHETKPGSIDDVINGVPSWLSKTSNDASSWLSKGSSTDSMPAWLASKTIPSASKDTPSLFKAKPSASEEDASNGAGAVAQAAEEASTAPAAKEEAAPIGAVAQEAEEAAAAPAVKQEAEPSGPKIAFQSSGDGGGPIMTLEDILAQPASMPGAFSADLSAPATAAAAPEVAKGGGGAMLLRVPGGGGGAGAASMDADALMAGLGRVDPNPEDDLAGHELRRSEKDALKVVGEGDVAAASHPGLAFEETGQEEEDAVEAGAQEEEGQQVADEEEEEQVVEEEEQEEESSKEQEEESNTKAEGQEEEVNDAEAEILAQAAEIMAKRAEQEEKPNLWQQRLEEDDFEEKEIEKATEELTKPSEPAKKSKPAPVASAAKKEEEGSQSSAVEEKDDFKVPEVPQKKSGIKKVFGFLGL